MSNLVSSEVTQDDIYGISCQSIRVLTERYKDDKDALSRILRFCVDTLPSSIDSQINERTSREERISSLKQASEDYINWFLDNGTQFFFFPSRNIYVSYDGLTFTISSEDEISHKVLQALSTHPDLSVWKHKIKSSVIHRIKERGVRDIIPSSETIQNVISTHCPSVFETRDETKYFLTALGDAVLKKQTHLSYFLPSRVKNLIENIIHGLMFFKGSSAASVGQYFKYHHQGQKLTDIRVLKIQGSGKTMQIPTSNILDIFFVAQHYSDRYGNADNLLNSLAANSSAQHALVLSSLENETQLTNWFLSECFEPSPTTDTCTDIDIQILPFVWKRFCHKQKIPMVVKPSSILNLVLTNQSLISPAISNDSVEHTKKSSSSSASVPNMRCKPDYLPNARSFLSFWDQTIQMILDPFPSGDKNAQESDLEQLEFDEINQLFRHWLNSTEGTQTSRAPIQDEDVESLLRHFYPHIEIEDSRFVLNVTCELWPKRQQILEFLETCRLIEASSPNARRSVSDLYSDYSKHPQYTALCTASKHYFEKVAQFYCLT
jgi:hypothetical protein